MKKPALSSSDAPASKPVNAPANAPANASGGALRADARRNREGLLTAADAVFAERGADASLDEIAKRAQVGIGTLYRHFPTREALLAAACDARLLTLAQESRAREAALPARDALRRFLEALVRHTSMYRGLAASLKVVLASGSPGCHATTQEGRRLLLRAKRAGEARRDASFADVVCMIAGIALAASQDAAGARRVSRLVEMFVDGLCASQGNGSGSAAEDEEPVSVAAAQRPRSPRRGGGKKRV